MSGDFIKKSPVPFHNISAALPMPSTGLEHRLTLLESELRHEKEDRKRIEEACKQEMVGVKATVKALETRLSYYDKTAVKITAVGMTVLTIGSFAFMGIDAVKHWLMKMWGLE
jgi:hypothetical protein